MRREPHKTKDGLKVWLDRPEVDLFLEHAKTTEQAIAFQLMARCGLRRKEVLDVVPPDVVDTDVGPRVRVRRGKGDKYREVPINGELKTSARVYAEQRDAADDVPLVDRSNRTINRWVNRCAERCAAETGDEGWLDVGPHDLRRTWGTLLVESGIEPGMIMVWGGWDDWDTFREHYLGAYSPEMERRQAAKVPWLEGRHEETHPSGSYPRGSADTRRRRRPGKSLSR